MRVNQEEIPSVSDVSPITPAQRRLNKKKSLQDLLAAVPPCKTYTPMQVQERPARPNLPGHVDINKPIDFYDLYLTRQHRVLFASYTNIKANIDLRDTKKEDRRKWHDTNEWEIGCFLGIILFMGLDHSPSIENYWNRVSIRPVYTSIQKAMPLARFQQIRRFFKISNPLNDADSSGPNWWKKLEPFASDFLKASRQHYMPGTHVSVDEQLILFKGRSKHTMQLYVKEAKKGFKIYTLCEGNYLLGLFFTSPVRKISSIK